MATTSSGIAELYADVVADLIPYYDNMVLLPNPQLIVNQYNLTGAVGNTVKIPLTNSWPAGNSSVTDNTDLINAGFDFNPGSVSLQVGKRGAGSLVSEESLEDGGFETVRNAVVTRLSRAIAQATDQSGTTDGQDPRKASGLCDQAAQVARCQTASGQSSYPSRGREATGADTGSPVYEGALPDHRAPTRWPTHVSVSL